jgi:hypothetical protein
LIRVKLSRVEMTEANRVVVGGRIE